MMRYLLDTQVVSYFLQARRELELASAAEQVACAIVEEDPARGELFERWFPRSGFQTIAIAIGSPADVILTRLQAGVASRRGGGERASIAVAASEPDCVFTGMDKGAMWIALRELWTPGERVISLPVFLRRLVDVGALEGTIADDVLSRSTELVPTWWADWRRG